MAGDWIKWCKGLERKAEVLVIASALSRSPEEVAGRLMKLWDWCDDNISDQQLDQNGHASVTLGAHALQLVDALTGVTGFADAMTLAGWIKQRGELIAFPNYSRHNGKTAKSRALSSDRQRHRRNAADAKLSRSKSDNCVTREEKRREETPIPPLIDSPNFRTAWSEWRKHRSEIKKPLTPTQAGKQLAMLAGLGESRAIAMIQYTIAKGWQGLREPEHAGHSAEPVPVVLPKPQEVPHHIPKAKFT